MRRGWRCVCCAALLRRVRLGVAALAVRSVVVAGPFTSAGRGVRNLGMRTHRSSVGGWRPWWWSFDGSCNDKGASPEEERKHVMIKIRKGLPVWERSVLTHLLPDEPTLHGGATFVLQTIQPAFLCSRMFLYGAVDEQCFDLCT